MIYTEKVDAKKSQGTVICMNRQVGFWKYIDVENRSKLTKTNHGEFRFLIKD